MTDQPHFTYQMRLRVEGDVAQALDGYAAIYSAAQRRLMARIAAGESASRLKSEFSLDAGLSARQFNALRIELEGKIASIKERRKGLVCEAQQRLKKLQGRIKKLSVDPDVKAKAKAKQAKIPSAKVVGKFEFAEQRKKRLFVLHHAKRREVMLTARLAQMQAEGEGEVARLCFGSKKLFHAQFDLPANGYADHAAWKIDWQAARNDQFLVLGSKDETAGCQGCQASVQLDGSLTLRVRLPDALGRYVEIPNVRFAYGHKAVLAALTSSERVAATTTSGKSAGKAIVKRTGTALTYRFARDETGWRVFVSVQARSVTLTSNRLLGAIGVDSNADHLAVSEVDRFGNLVHAAKLPTITYGKSTDQAKAVLGDAAVAIARRAKAQGKPVVIELLDFQKKKADLQTTSPRQARMLSSFASNKVASSIKAACYRAGVEVIEVSPAYTSVIGAVNHAQSRGISVHMGAALAVARRGLCLSERPTVRRGVSPARNGGHVTFELPARNRSKHVWTYWSDVRIRLKAAHVEHFRCGELKKPQPPLSPCGRTACATGDCTVRPRDANRPHHCSVNVIATFPDVPL